MIKKQFLKSKPVCKATFTLPKATVNGAKEVLILGEFNNWNSEEATKMKKQKGGAFKATVELETGKEYQFRYLLDGEKWENEVEADKVVMNEFGDENSVVVTLN